MGEALAHSDPSSGKLSACVDILEICRAGPNLFSNCSHILDAQMVASSDAAPLLAVTYRPVGTLRPDPRNARTHPKQQVDQIVASIRQFGFVNPILADPDGRIIAGHGRLMAAKAMGLAEVPTIHIHGLSETQKRALRIADNKIALGAGWDLDVLKMELAELESSISSSISP